MRIGVPAETRPGEARVAATAMRSASRAKTSSVVAPSSVGTSGSWRQRALPVVASATSFPAFMDIRQRGVMVGIELCQDRDTREPFDFASRAELIANGLDVEGVRRSIGCAISVVGAMNPSPPRPTPTWRCRRDRAPQYCAPPERSARPPTP